MQLEELHKSARTAGARRAPSPTPTPKIVLDPRPADEGRAEAGENRVEEPELRDVLANTPWSSILVPFAVGLLAMAVSILLVLKTD